MAAHSLRSLDFRRLYPADPRETGYTFHRAGVAGYESGCPSGKLTTMALFQLYTCWIFNREAMAT